MGQREKKSKIKNQNAKVWSRRATMSRRADEGNWPPDRSLGSTLRFEGAGRRLVIAELSFIVGF